MMNYGQYGQAAPGNYQYGHPGMYGSNGPVNGAFPSMAPKGPFLRGMRQRLNIVAILIALFVPWLLFCFIYWTMSFNLHYKQPFINFIFVGIGLLVVVVIGLLAYDAVKKKKREAGVFEPSGATAYHQPTWLIFLFVTCLLAWLLGVFGGDMNFFHNLEPYYDVINLNTYPDVDPSRMRGQQLMDAGRIMFANTTTLDLSRSMGFKNLHLYCVAPIVAGNDIKHISSYDFWAVGIDCCSGNRADFHCGEFNNARAGAGLRLMRDDERAFFRLAVQQAEAAYNIRADHPLFFYWMQDPIAEVATWMDEGYKWFLLGIFSHFLLQLVLVMIACLAFSKLGQLS